MLGEIVLLKKLGRVRREERIGMVGFIDTGKEGFFKEVMLE